MVESQRLLSRPEEEKALFYLQIKEVYAIKCIVNTITLKWLEYAKADLEAAEVLTKSGKTSHSYQLAILHCHQAIEKILKTWMVSKNEVPKRIHDLVKLAQDADIKISERSLKYISELYPHYQPARYPDISYQQTVLKYDSNKAQYHLGKTKELFRWLEKKILRK